MAPRSIALLIEGDGDYEAVPLLVRKIAIEKSYHDLTIGTKPIKVGDAHAIMKSEKFVRLFEYALTRDDIDAVLIAADCEDHCPVEAVQAAYARIEKIVDRIKKPVGFSFFCREFETMFLVNADHLSRHSKSVILDPKKIPTNIDLMTVRNAKGMLKGIISTNTYKETRDQARLTGAMGVAKCADEYRPLKHLVNVVEWLYHWDGSRYRY
jgi:hypothetical protein